MSTQEDASINIQRVAATCESHIIVLSADNEVLHISPGLCMLLGISVEATVGRSASSLNEIHDALREQELVQIVDAEGHSRYLGHSRQTSVGAAPLVLHIFTDYTQVLDLLTQNEVMQEEIRQLQLIDPDTSLLTKRALRLVLEPQVSRARRYETPLSIVKMAVVPKASCSDAGAMIVQISRLLKDQLRWADMIARSGTLDFTMVLPETDRQAAVTMTTKLKAGMEPWEDDCEIYFGLAEWARGNNSADLLQSVDDDVQASIQSRNHGQDVA
jgi:GGDEF domain-containing protein